MFIFFKMNLKSYEFCTIICKLVASLHYFVFFVTKLFYLSLKYCRHTAGVSKNNIRDCERNPTRSPLSFSLLHQISNSLLMCLRAERRSNIGNKNITHNINKFSYPRIPVYVNFICNFCTYSIWLYLQII